MRLLQEIRYQIDLWKLEREKQECDKKLKELESLHYGEIYFKNLREDEL